MSMHISNRPLFVAYSPSQDPKWRPEDMGINKWYPVFGYENGNIKLSDGKRGEAFFFHFIGEGSRPCRLIQGNAVLALDVAPNVFPDHGNDKGSSDRDFNPA